MTTTPVGGSSARGRRATGEEARGDARPCTTSGCTPALDGQPQAAHITTGPGATPSSSSSGQTRARLVRTDAGWRPCLVVATPSGPVVDRLVTVPEAGRLLRVRESVIRDRARGLAPVGRGVRGDPRRYRLSALTESQPAGRVAPLVRSDGWGRLAA